MKKLFFILMLCTSILPSIFAQPMSVYSCITTIVRPWEGYLPGVIGGGTVSTVSKNAAIEYWTNIFVSDGLPREIFEVACTLQGNYNPLGNPGAF